MIAKAVADTVKPNVAQIANPPPAYSGTQPRSGLGSRSGREVSFFDVTSSSPARHG
jgi:hypothetical protein